MTTLLAKAELVAFYRRAEKEATVTSGGNLVFSIENKKEIVRLMKVADMNGGALANCLIAAGDYGRVSGTMHPIVYNRIAVRVNTFKAQIEKAGEKGLKERRVTAAYVPPRPSTPRPSELSIKLSRMREERKELDEKIEKLHEKLLQLDANIDTLEAAKKILG